MTHYFSALLLVLTLALWAAGSYMTKDLSPNMPRIRAPDIVPAVVIFASWLAFVAVGPMLTGIRYAADYSSALARLVSAPFGLHGVPQPTGIHLTVQEAVVVYVGFLVAGGVGLVAITEGIRNLKKRINSRQGPDMAGILSFGVIAILLGAPAVAGIFLSAPEQSDIPSRFVTFVYFFWSPAFGVGIWFARKRIDRLLLRRTSMSTVRVGLVSLCIASLLILPVASTWLLLPSTMRGQTTLDDQEVRTFSSWLRTHGDKSFTLMGDDIMATATAALARQSSTQGYLPPPDEGTRLNGMLYYAENMTLLTHYLSTEPRGYILVNKMYLSHKYYLISYFYEGRPPPSQEEMEASLSNLSSLPMVNAVSSSGSMVLYAAFSE
jgi:hypothetical protein